MIRNRYVASFLFLLAGTVLAADAPPDRAVAVTFDDLPKVSVPSTDLDGYREFTRRLLAAIKKHDVPALGLVTGRNLYTAHLEGDLSVLLEMWLDAGLELGNHTWSHGDFNVVSLEEFQADLVRVEEAVRPLAAARDRPFRYFRHPMLHTGRDLAKRDALVDFLAERGYTVAPVTIDNSEWIFARAYARAAEVEDRDQMDRIAAYYLDYMEKMVAYYEKQSVDLLGYEIKQVLLLHANLLNADHFDALARMMRGRGYRFVPLEEALADPAYGLPDTYTGPSGITWIQRWALTRGIDPSVFAGEPDTPEFVKRAAGIASE